MPALSVILPVHNASAYLRPAVESVLAQEGCAFELILIDDGSTDDSLAVCREFEADGRVRLVSRANKGFAATLNEGMGLAEGELIGRMDGDDVCLPGRFAKQVTFMREHPEVTLLGAGYWFTDEAGRRIRTFVPPGDDGTLQRQLLSGRNPICHPACVYRKQAALDAGGFRDEYRPAEDLELWLRLGEAGRIACLPDVLLEYRQHGGSMSAVEQGEQVEHIRRACRESNARRGTDVPFEGEQPWRPGGDRGSRHAFACRYGWWALGSGEPATAATYGRRAVGIKPWDVEGWKLWIKGSRTKARSA